MSSEPPPTSDEEDAALKELEGKWKRALADTDNLRKRHARELDVAHVAERRKIAALWLPIVDNLERALGHAEEDTPLVIGVRAVRDQAVELLATLGFPRDEQTGVPFDPQRHEAIAIEPGDEPGTVLSVLRPGYGNGHGQLRPAAVTVAGERDL